MSSTVALGQVAFSVAWGMLLLFHRFVLLQYISEWSWATIAELRTKPGVHIVHSSFPPPLSSTVTYYNIVYYNYYVMIHIVNN